MGYAGTPGMVWGWLIAMVFIQCVAMSMAELCSSMPTSGGLYYASAVLAPPGWGPLAACKTQCIRILAVGSKVDRAIRVDGLVKLAGPSDWCTIGRLRNVSNDTRRSFHHAAGLRSDQLADLPIDDADHAHPWMHQQHAYQVARQLQLGWVNIQYHRLVHRTDPYSRLH